MFESILGNQRVKEYLKKAVQQTRVPHTLLFLGMKGIGKSLFAKELASALLEADLSRIEKNIHPDFHSLHPEGKSGLHSIESVRNLIQEVHAAPFESKCKVFVVYEAEKMQSVAASALLKTLEEPTPGSYLILLAESIQELLPTLCSRCIILRFQPLESKDMVYLLKVHNLSEEILAKANGSIGKALEVAAYSSLETKVFQFISKIHPYFEVQGILESIEKEVTHEDPFKEKQAVDTLFHLILSWYRDQWIRKSGQKQSLLFFPKEPLASRSLESMDKIQEKIKKAKQAYERNIKLAVCLDLFRPH